MILLALLEIFARNFLDLGSNNGAYTDDVIGQIYGRDKIADYQIVLSEQSMGWEYHPLVEYKESPRAGSFVTVSSDNIRCNQNETDSCQIQHGKGTIWVFGGSTVFGYGVKNNETIPAHLSKLLPNYQVINMGHSSYYSTLERILFNEKISEGMVPEIAVFIDGLNDFYYNKIPSESGASKGISERFESTLSVSTISYMKSLAKKSHLVKWLYGKVKRDWNRSQKDDSFLKPSEHLQRVISRLEFNFTARQVIGKLNGIKVLNVLQPVPGYGIGHKTSKVPDHLLRFGEHVNSAKGYQIIKKQGFKSEVEYLDLSDLAIDTAMFIDTVHYSPEFNQKIASEISNEIARIVLK